MAPLILGTPAYRLLKRFALIYAAIVVVLTALIFSAIALDHKLRITTKEVQELSQIEVGKAQLVQDLNVVDVDLRIIAKLPLLQSYLDTQDAALRAQLEQLFLVFAQETRRYDQIRYLDVNGREDIRIDFNGGQPSIVARAQLQNKAARYYFKDTIKLEPQHIFVSSLDLNIEAGALEIPYKPMIRYGTPVFNSRGEKCGIIMLNYLGAELLQNFRAAVHSNNPQSGMLLTHNGYWLKGSNSQDEWGFMLNKSQLTFGNRYPDAWRAMTTAAEGTLLNDDGLFVFSTVYPLQQGWHSVTNATAAQESEFLNIRDQGYHWKIVSYIPKNLIYQNAFYNQPQGKDLLGLIYLLFALSALFIARLSLTRQMAKAEVIELNHVLEQRLAEHAAGEENLAVTLRSIGDGVLTTDKDGYVTRLNSVAEQLTGWSQQEAVGRSITEVFHIINQKTRAPETMPIFATLAQGTIHRLRGDVLLIARDGKECPIADSCAPIFNRAGSVIGAVKVFRDITERKLIEQHLITAKDAAERANLTKDAFLATMSHEIRTPLTGLLGMLEVLSMGELDVEQHKTLSAAWDSARNLLRIVNDILDWSKIQEGKLALSPQSTSIPQLLQEVINTYSRVASTKCLLLVKHEDPRLSAAHIVDPLRLSQILNNFVSNAIKFTHHGKVELRAELLEQLESGERIRFSVKDSGVGIPEEVQKNLFQRFQQESADTARQYGGTGLGLSICLRLAELLDGQIDLDSKPDQGATFSFTAILPISAAPGEQIPLPVSAVEQKKVTPLVTNASSVPLILAVDDHPINRDLLARQIKLLGLNAKTAENGQVALSMWQAERFALVITDCHMPELDGYGFVRALRKIEAEQKLAPTPVIAWTANARTEERQFCTAAGMDDLLVKPADLSQLKKMLMKWLVLEDKVVESPSDATKSTVSEQPEGPINFNELSKVVPEPAEQMDVLQSYSVHIRTDFAKLQQDFERKSCANLEQLAHRMKGASKMVGATHIARACYEIELGAKDEGLPKAAIAYERLLVAIEEFESYLNNLK
jgi:PAS domain S-box-containing protein